MSGQTPAESSLDYGRQMQMQLTEQSVAAGNRVGAWLVIGNAGALVVVFNAMIVESRCTPEFLSTSGVAFAIGLTCSFAAAAIAYVNATYSLSLMTKVTSAQGDIVAAQHHVSRLDAQGISTEPGDPLQDLIDASEAKLPLLKKQLASLFWGAAIAILLYLASAGSFLVGVFAPITDSQALKACVQSPTTRGAAMGFSSSSPNAEPTTHATFEPGPTEGEPGSLRIS